MSGIRYGKTTEARSQLIEFSKANPDEICCLKSGMHTFEYYKNGERLDYIPWDLAIAEQREANIELNEVVERMPVSPIGPEFRHDSKEDDRP